MRGEVFEHLQGVFGIAELRPEQAVAVEAFLAGRDVSVVLPTGFGKSLCFQLPAVALARAGLGCTLVVSPLIALMNDQVRALRERGVRAAALHSAVPFSEQRGVLASIDAHELVYVSPERLENARVRERLRTVARVAIDEAHCISEWGHDFRPEYAALGWIKRELGVPVMALTATATKRVRAHIVESLALREPVCVSANPLRPNLSFRVMVADGRETRTHWVVELLQREGFAEKRVADRAILYAVTRARVQSVQRALRKAGVRAGYYHAGRSESARRTAEERFRSGVTPVLVATSAFGMGVDFSQVRLVVHVEAPGTLESYVQQAGRAGRDGAPATCWLGFAAADAQIHARLRGRKPLAPGSDGFAALQDYALGDGCRQLAIARFFELEEAARPCGACDLCVDPALGSALRAQAEDAEQRSARPAKKGAPVAPLTPLSERERALVIAFVDAMPKPVGRRYVMMALRGSRARALGKKRLLTNPHHGALQSASEESIYAAFDELLAEGLLVRKGQKYPTLWVAGKAVRARSTRAERPRASSLELSLRRFRRNEAKRRRIKPYQVFQDRTLRALCECRPRDLPALREVWGIGEERIDKYGEKLLALCAEAS